MQLRRYSRHLQVGAYTRAEQGQLTDTSSEGTQEELPKLTKNRNDAQAVREIHEYVVFKTLRLQILWLRCVRRRNVLMLVVAAQAGTGYTNRLDEVRKAIDGIQGSGNFVDSLSNLLQDNEGDRDSET